MEASTTRKKVSSPPEQAVTLRAMISCADENAHMHTSVWPGTKRCAAASNEGEDHSRWWKHCWMPQQQEKKVSSPPEQTVTLRAMISCADENAHISVAGAKTMAFHPPCAAGIDGSKTEPMKTRVPNTGPRNIPSCPNGICGAPDLELIAEKQNP